MTLNSFSKKPRIVALIPLRKGSKSIPYKNIKLLGGKPLCFWAMRAAKNCPYINDVYVSTDDQKIKDVVQKLNLGVKVIDRPKKYATDTASTESVMLNFAKNVDFEILVTMQATSPLTTSRDLNEAIKKFIAEKYASMFTAVRVKRFFWNENEMPINYNYRKRPRRQEFKGTLMENGAFYLTKRRILEKYKNRLGGKIGIHLMPAHTAVELDEPHDWEKVEKILKIRRMDYNLS